MGSTSSGLMSRKRGKTHPLRTPNRSPNLCDGEEPGCQTSSSPCRPIFGNSKAQPMDNFPYPRLSIYGKPPRPPSKPTPQPPLPPPPTHNPVPQTSHSQDTPPFKYMYDGTKRTPQSPPTDTALPSVPFKVRLRPTKPEQSPDTPPGLSYLYDGRAQTVQGDTLLKVLDPSPVTPLPLTYLYDGLKPPITKVVDPQPITPLPSTYLYDGLKIRPSQQPHRGNVVPKFGEWDENNISSVDAFTHIFNKVREEKRKYDVKKKGCCLPWSRK